MFACLDLRLALFIFRKSVLDGHRCGFPEVRGPVVPLRTGWEPLYLMMFISEINS